MFSFDAFLKWFYWAFFFLFLWCNLFFYFFIFSLNLFWFSLIESFRNFPNLNSIKKILLKFTFKDNLVERHSTADSYSYRCSCYVLYLPKVRWCPKQCDVLRKWLNIRIKQKFRYCKMISDLHCKTRTRKFGKAKVLKSLILINSRLLSKRWGNGMKDAEELEPKIILWWLNIKKQVKTL